MATTAVNVSYDVTSDPKPSSKYRGFDYIYFSKPTASGSDCTLLVRPALRDLIRKGSKIYDHQIQFDEQIGHSILFIDFDRQPADDTQIPPDSETGWNDDDHLTAILPEPVALAPAKHTSPRTVRRQEAQVRAAEFNLPFEFLERLELLARAQRFVSTLIGVNEKPRPMDAQKLVVTAWIDYSRSRGVEISEEDEKLLRNL